MAKLPLIQLADVSQGFSVPIKMGEFIDGLPRAKWLQIRIPLSRFKAESLRGFDPTRLDSVVFIQGATDSSPHSFVIDDIKIDFAARTRASLPAPANVLAKGYDRHIDVAWEPVSNSKLQHYAVFRSENGKHSVLPRKVTSEYNICTLQRPSGSK